MPEKLGIIGLAFGMPAPTSNDSPSNAAVARVAERIKFENPGSRFVTQWEVADQSTGTAVNTVISDSTTREYITTEEALWRSVGRLTRIGINHIVIVAHPDHLRVVKLFIKLRIWRFSGVKFVTSYDARMKAIPYDRSPTNRQWWTKSRGYFAWYLVKTLFTRHHGA